MTPQGTHDKAFITKFFRNLLRIHREFFGGSWTVNQVIVGLHVSIDFIEGRPCTAGELARAEGMSQQAVSDALNALRRNGLLTEKVDPKDARRRYIEPSDKYLRLRSEIGEAMFNGVRNI